MNALGVIYCLFLLTGVASEAEDWIDFTKENIISLSVNMPEKELYLVRLPCHQNYWFKLHLYYGGEAAEAKNAHIELNQDYNPGQGTIFCMDAGSKTEYGGEMTTFYVDTSPQCEDDGRYKIIQVEKSTNAVELKNKGKSLYKKDFTSTDGYCRRWTGKIETQVWDNEGTLSTLSLQIGACTNLPNTAHLSTDTEFPVERGRDVTVFCTHDWYRLSGDNIITCQTGTSFSYNSQPLCLLDLEMTCKTIQYVKEGRTAKLRAVLNKTSTWEEEILKISGKVNSITYKGGSGIASKEVRHQTDKLEISGVNRYSVQIQKQGSSVSCSGELIVYNT